MVFSPKASRAQDDFSTESLDDAIAAELDNGKPSGEDDLAAELGDNKGSGTKVEKAPSQTAASSKDAPAPVLSAAASPTPAPTPAPQPAPEPKLAEPAPDIVPQVEPAAEPTFVAPAEEPKLGPQTPEEPTFDTSSEPMLAEPEPPKPVEAPKASSRTAQVDMGEPNFAFEKRLHRIFSRATPVAEDKWSEMIAATQQDYYSIQAGDTLWDISQTLFGDGFFWSKLWAENGAIENPHQIKPGKALRFVAGNESNAPSVSVADASLVAQLGTGTIGVAELREDEATAPVYREQMSKQISHEDIAGGMIEESELIPAPDIPEAKRSTPPLLKLPPSFVSRQISLNAQYDKTGLDVGKRSAMTVPATVIANSFLGDSTPSSIGKVEELEAGEQVAAQGQHVFVRLNHEAKTGDRFSVFYLRGKVAANVVRSHPVVEVGGTIEVVEAVNASRGVYRALVVTGINPVRAGSIVSEEALPKVVVDFKGRRNPAELKVLGGEFDENRRLLGTNALIYLDGGENVGVKDGDLLAVQARRGERRAGSRVSEWTKPIAVVKVVKSGSQVSTAIVLNSFEEIVPGDRTGSNFPAR
jgi:nucleoid-associated protein YgaU